MEAVGWLRERGYDRLTPGAIQRHRRYVLARLAIERDEAQLDRALLRLFAALCSDFPFAPTSVVRRTPLYS
jgi:hypothetical protein